MHIKQVSNIFIENLSFKCPQKIFAKQLLILMDEAKLVKNTSSLRTGYLVPIFLKLVPNFYISYITDEHSKTCQTKSYIR